MNANIIKKASDMINSLEISSIAIVNNNGYPFVSTISKIKSEGIYTLYFATSLMSKKVKILKHNNKASICFADINNNVTLTGETEILTDEDSKKEHWADWFINHFTGGVNDPDYCILKFTTISACLYIDNETSIFDISDIIIPQSRCGLLCASCSFKNSHGCNGCIETNGCPFYGECHIAACCQNKGYTHCGECETMPCEQLLAYSCSDTEQSDKPKGARIEILKKWAECKNSEVLI